MTHTLKMGVKESSQRILSIIFELSAPENPQNTLVTMKIASSKIFSDRPPRAALAGQFRAAFGRTANIYFE